MAEAAPTFRTLITSFTDFLVVAIHTILYERAVYPQTSFLSARKYNFPVRQSRHPKVCEWINDAVAAVEAELLNCAVEQVAVVIYDNNNKPLERYVFDASRFPIVAASDLDIRLEVNAPDGENTAAFSFIDMEEQFRATMSKLAACSSKLGSTTQGCTFTVAIELKRDRAAPVSHPQPWMPVEPRALNNTVGRQTPTTKPIRAVRAGEMVFELWIEQFDKVTDEG